MNLLFDLDGTLADPFEAICDSLYHAFDVHEIPKPGKDSVRDIIGPPLQTTLPGLLKSNDESLAKSVLATYRQHHTENCVVAYHFYEDIEGVLKTLSKHHQLFVATSKPITMTVPIIKHHGLAKYFKNLYGSELSGERSAKADLIKYILSEEKLKTSETIMIGDRKHDIIGAKANGIKSVGVLWGYGSRQELKEAGADQICETIPDLLAFFP